MILHILKKDLKLVWPAMVAVAVLKAAAAWAVMQMGLFNDQPNLKLLHGLIEQGCSLAIVFTVVWAAQNDPIISDNADWLTRPINRAHLVLAKALIVLIVTSVPVFAVNLMVGLSHGLAFTECFTRSILPAIKVFFMLGLPAMALSAITNSRIQAAGTIGVILVVLVVELLAHTMITHSLMFPGGLWSIALVQTALVVGVSIFVLGLQYSQRRTSLSRAISAGAVACLMATMFLPWDVALRLEHFVDGKAADTPIRIGFNAQARMRKPAVPDLSGTPTLYVPLILTKKEGSIASTDSVQLQLQSPDGRVLYKNQVGIAENHGASSLTKLALDPSSMSSTATYADIAMSNGNYSKFKGKVVRASLTYYFAAYRASAPIQVLIPPARRQTIDHVGVCESRRNKENPAYTDLYCFPAADQGPCLGGSVRYVDTGKIVSLKVRCPHQAQSSDIGIITPGELIAAYPTPADNATVQITLTPYRLQSHFMQTVMLPPMHLEYLTPPGPGDQ